MADLELKDVVKLHLEGLRESGLIVDEITIKHDSLGNEIVYNSDTKNALIMMIDIMKKLEEAVEILCFMNDSGIGTDKYLVEIEIDIKSLSDIVDKMQIALSNKDYLNDDSILPQLTISGNNLHREVTNRDFERTWEEEVC